MLFNIENVQKFLKSLCGYEITEDDEFLLDLAVEERTNYVLDFCNIKVIPECLQVQLIRMVAGEFLYQKKLLVGAEGLGIDIEPLVSSIHIDDTTTSYSTNGELSQEAALDLYLDNLRNGNRLTLQEHRKLRW